jgi:mycothiol synthase
VRLIEILQHAGERDRHVAREFVEEISELVGSRPLSDHLWLDLQSDASQGLVLIRVAEGQRTLAIAQISATNQSESLEIVVRPDLVDADRVHADAFETAIDTFQRLGGGRLIWWIDNPTDTLRALADRHQLVRTRELHEMRCTLPLDVHASLATRAFVPGIDDAAWLDVNNRAFATHGEQGGWTIETLQQRFSEPWFEPAGFRIYERAGRLAAFCWTKIDRAADPVLGEIYVIAVDPDFHGQGLGRELTLAGLDSISERGVSIATLYVDADNAAAVSLYDRLGFTIHRTRLAFSADLPSSKG